MDKYNAFLNEAKEKVAVQRKIKDKGRTPKIVRVGSEYIDFRSVDLRGDTVKFSDIIMDKKLILLDFWDSWCKPCLEEMPVIDSLYRKYRVRGLEIIGVSLDRNPEAWKRTVFLHKMNWEQLRELKDIDGNVSDIWHFLYSLYHFD